MARKRLHSPEPAIADVAALLGDAGRCAMLCALWDGRERSAGELAAAARLAPNAASGHLAKLAAAGLVEARSAGRHRYFALANPLVADAIEALSAIARPAKIVALDQARIAHDLREARSCYDHLAGRLGVAVTDALIRRRCIAAAGGKDYRLTASGERFLDGIGVDVEAARCTNRHFARRCLDWSERRPHLAGALGAHVRDLFLRNDWVRKERESRALRVTDRGKRALAQIFAARL